MITPGPRLLACASLVLVCATYAENPLAVAPQSQGFGLGVRGNLQLAEEGPVHNLSGYGLYGRLQLGGNREVGIGVDMLSDDIDDPAGMLGLQESEQAAPLSAKITANVFSVWGRQNFDVGLDRIEPFVLAGLGLASIDMDSSKVRLQDGSAFDLRADAGTEHIFMLGGGIRSRLADNLGLEVAVRGEYHLANWTVEDRVSGAYIALDDYFALGLYAALCLNF